MRIQPSETPRRSRSVTIVTDEPAGSLAPVSAALEARGIESVVVPVWIGTQVGATYIRAIDRQLNNASAFARIASVAAHPNLVVNTPGSVRVAEWLPLATVFRDRGVPQPARLWCFAHDDIAAAAEQFGPDVVIEGTVSHTRVRASSPDAVRAAFDAVVDGHEARGALVESPIRGATAEVSILVVDGERMPLPGQADRLLPTATRRRAALVAAQAVSALGAAVMAVDIAVNQRGEAHVIRVDAAPRVDRLGERAIEAVVHAISRRARAAALAEPAFTHTRTVEVAASPRGQSRRHGNRDAPAAYGCDAPGPRPGFILTCGGSAHRRLSSTSTRATAAHAPVLHVRGGISGSLCYAIRRTPWERLSRRRGDSRCATACASSRKRSPRTGKRCSASLHRPGRCSTSGAMTVGSRGPAPPSASTPPTASSALSRRPSATPETRSTTWSSACTATSARATR